MASAGRLFSDVGFPVSGGRRPDEQKDVPWTSEKRLSLDVCLLTSDGRLSVTSNGRLFNDVCQTSFPDVGFPVSAGRRADEQKDVP